MQVIEDALLLVTKKISKQLNIGKDNYYNTYKLLIDG